jgi:hypothetical protein
MKKKTRVRKEERKTQEGARAAAGSAGLGSAVLQPGLCLLNSPKPLI